MTFKPVIDIPGLGPAFRNDFHVLISQPVCVPVLGGKMLRCDVHGYEDDGCKEDFHEAIRNFLSLDESILKTAEEGIFQYYLDIAEERRADDDGSDADPCVEIESPAAIWAHIRLGGGPGIQRRLDRDRAVYVIIGGNCDWEEEHGLQIVFRNGLIVSEVGPMAGYPVNTRDDVIYESFIVRSGGSASASSDGDHGPQIRSDSGAGGKSDSIPVNFDKETEAALVRRFLSDPLRPAGEQQDQSRAEPLARPDSGVES